ncbi:MAG: hypothetical protein FWE32_00620 [Oscillospiraceae bacterium]|nr:hypothetical protein [Oscillospiraceae bacterium]
MRVEDKQLLLKQAAKLYQLGLQVEQARSNLKNLVERGVSYDNPKMAEAYRRFVEIDNQWKRLEVEHLEFRKKCGIENQ